MKIILPFLICALWSITTASAQNTQTISGIIVDQDSHQPLYGATIVVVGSDPLQGAVTDFDGFFELKDVPVGRVTLTIKMLGYEAQYMEDLSLSSGKTLQLNLSMQEAFQDLKVVEITAETEEGDPLNEMATVSARSFSVEETQRYAASVSDPARMAGNFAGVVSAGDDIMNEIAIRGNSPRGIMWRIEGIEVPNPNHFGSLGSSGGGISMLSSSTLAQSDFYTGAFPAEFGNATSGVFDIKLRNGNNQQREHSVQIGLLGLEASTSGYFSKNSNASYLVNYRYSTFGLLSLVYNPLGDVLPAYQDASFKLHFPTKKAGTFSVFGLAGANSAVVKADRDTTLWESEDDQMDFFERQQVGIVGAGHVKQLGERTYIKTVAAYSLNRFQDETTFLSGTTEVPDEIIDETSFTDDHFRATSTINYKFNARNTFKTGAIFTHNTFAFKYDYKDLDDNKVYHIVDAKGSAMQVQHFTQWRHRFTENVVGNIGYHMTYLDLNDGFSIEPRAAIEWQATAKQKWSLAAGLHSKPEHVSTYYLSGTNANIASPSSINSNLEIPKSAHFVLGYGYRPAPKWNITAEVYYQHLYKIAVDTDSAGISSAVNVNDIWDIIGAQSPRSTGTGANYGLDLNIQKSFSDGYYVLISSSIYSAKYQGNNGNTYNSRYNGNYVLNVLGGKEWTLKDPNKTFGVNGKFLWAGGKRATPLLSGADHTDEPVYDLAEYNTVQLPDYLRFDLGISYTVNKANSTHRLSLDIQNVTNYSNIYNRYYSTETQGFEYNYQTGIFPFINYRIEFQGKRKG